MFVSCLQITDNSNIQWIFFLSLVSRYYIKCFFSYELCYFTELLTIRNVRGKCVINIGHDTAVHFQYLTLFPLWKVIETVIGYVYSIEASASINCNLATVINWFNCNLSVWPNFNITMVVMLCNCNIAMEAMWLNCNLAMIVMWHSCSLAILIMWPNCNLAVVVIWLNRYHTTVFMCHKCNPATGVMSLNCNLVMVVI